jgi:hypothetical protein
MKNYYKCYALYKSLFVIRKNSNNDFYVKLNSYIRRYLFYIWLCWNLFLIIIYRHVYWYNIKIKWKFWF